MADNVTTQSANPATPAAGSVIAARSVTYSGDAGALIAPVGLVQFSGSDDAKTATDVNTLQPLYTRFNGANASVASVSASASNVTVLAANVNRFRALLYNDDAAKSVYIKFGATASLTSFTKKMLPLELFVVEVYTGIIDGIWETGPTGAMRVTEIGA